MELYVLDSTFRRVEVIDKFESLIWTERFQDYGDFELSLYSNPSVRTLLTAGTHVFINKSNRIMTVNEVENRTESDGRKTLTVKGHSFEKILDDRVASYKLSDKYLNSLSKGVVTYNATYDYFDTATNHDLKDGDQVYFKTSKFLPGSLLNDDGSDSYTGANITGFDYTNDVFRVNKHGLANGDVIYIKKASGGTLPTGLTEGQYYYVIVKDADLLQVASTQENAKNNLAIAISGTSVGTHTVYLSLDALQPYFVIRISDTRIKLAISYENSISEDGIDAIPLNLFGTVASTMNLYYLNENTWRVKGKPRDILESIFNRFCVNPEEPIDTLFIYKTGSLYSTNGDLDEIQTEYTLDFANQSVYQIINELCKIWNFGFRITRSETYNKIHFNIYSGSNRTLNQTANTPVIFDLNLENLLNEASYISTKNYKNVAYVYSLNSFLKVYTDGVDEFTTNLDKKILLVDASDITGYKGSELTAQLEQRGRQALSENAKINAFDGEISPTNQYKYEADYFLGDLVEVKDIDGYSVVKRVTEQIFSEDEQGEKSFPTLSTQTVSVPGSWYAFTQNTAWNDASLATKTWAQL
jgi:hypothetical protein